VEATTTSKGYQGVVSWILSFVDRDQLDGVDHVLVSNSDDTLGNFLRSHAKRTSQLLHCLLNQLHVGMLASTEEVFVDSSKVQVGISGCHIISTFFVCNWTWNGSCTLRTNMEFPELISPSDGTTAATNFN